MIGGGAGEAAEGGVAETDHDFAEDEGDAKVANGVRDKR